MQATFVCRHKRFSVQTVYENTSLWVHSNNTGSMLGLTRPGVPLLASPANNPRRKLSHTQEAIWLGAQSLTDSRGFWVGVNTAVPNKMLAAAFQTRALPFASGYTEFTPEAKCGTSRMDALLRGSGQPDLWVECKNVTLVEDEVALFPDAPTERGQKHLRELMDVVSAGDRAAMFYLIQRPDARCFAPADMIDPAYTNLFWEAKSRGVEIYPFVAYVSPTGIELGALLPVRGCDRLP